MRMRWWRLLRLRASRSPPEELKKSQAEISEGELEGVAGGEGVIELNTGFLCDFKPYKDFQR
jgi:hypothetical protein